MRLSWVRRRAVARGAIGALVVGVLLLAALAVFSLEKAARATAEISAAETNTQQWGLVYQRIGIEYEQLVDFVRADSPVGREPLIASIGSAEEGLRWLNAHGGPSESFQAQSLQNTYGGYSYTLHDLVQAQADGDRRQMLLDAEQASLSASALRKQASVNIARNRLVSAAVLAETQRSNHRLLVAVTAISGLDLAVVFFCTLVLIAYQRNTERQARENRHRAAHDGLTGIANRSLLTERLDEAIAGGKAGLLLLDLNRFKEVNDTLGHHAGDVLIQEVARRLVASARDYDTVARLGGDEFAIVLPDVHNTDDLLKLGQRILAAVCLPAEIDGVTVDVGASIGASLFPLLSADAAELLQHADVAMYTAKRGHRGVALYDPTADENSFERLSLVGELRRAIENGELELHYQPKVRVADRTVCGVEALVRWRHPVRGLVFPDQFVPVAEENGLIRPLTDAVLELALAQQRSWRADGRRIPVAVNVGADCLLDPGFTDRLRELTAVHGTAPEDLTVEITEGAVIADPVQAAVVLTEVRELGVRVSIDDFGTGYSSMSYLQEMPLDELKIDRRFTARIDAAGSGRAIVAAIADLAHALDLEVVAEGVEDESVLIALGDIGCESAQGYHMCRPRPAGEVWDWIVAASAEPAETRV